MLNIYELQNEVQRLLKLIDKKENRYAELRSTLVKGAKRKYLIIQVQDYSLTKKIDRENLVKLAEEFIKTPTITKSTLKQRGWTEGTIAKYLGTPDATVKNPVYKSAALMQLYSLIRVETIETNPIVQTSLKKIAVQKNTRSIGAQKAVATKTAKLLTSVDLINIEIPLFKIGTLVGYAVQHYNNLWSDRSNGQSDKHASTKDESEFLVRIVTNYLRHDATDYELELDAIAGKVGNKEVYCELKSKINNEIDRVYPNLERQILDWQQNKVVNKKVT